MSILLKALKKSEAQRQVGQPPDIHTPIDLSDQPVMSERRWLPLLLIMVIVAIVAWYAWQRFAGVESPPDRVVAENAVDAAGEVEDGKEPVSVSVERAARNDRTTDVATVRPPGVANFPSGRSKKSEDRKRTLNQSFTRFEAAEEEEPLESADDEVDDDEVDRQVSVSSGDEDLASTIADDAGFSDLESAVDALAGDAQDDRTEAAESRRRNSRQGSEMVATGQGSEPISFWQVPQNVRDGMPEFRITVLVYAEEPEDRFVLVNGVRLKEKEELDSGLELDEIRRDGAVFIYRNYRFLIKG